MAMFSQIILKIKRQETPFYTAIYRMAKFLNYFNFPTIKAIHLPLYYIDSFIRLASRRLFHSFWSIPLFKARCEECGKNLSLPNGIPLVTGGHLKIYLGDNVTIGRSTIGASKVFDEPVLKIGSNSCINYGSVISVAKEIIIGNNCLIAGNCLIMDSADHPSDPEKRVQEQPVDVKDVEPVRIGNNVWIGAYSAVLKGVTIGENSIVGTHSVVTSDVPANCIFAGVPARLVRQI
jgi:acetyltransferase-like isoleucine patch superfamily enzyme